jgi:ferrochelatase
LRELRRDVVIVPIGFLSDHMEVIYDLDTEVRRLCGELGICMARAGTAGTHPAMIEMVATFLDQEPLVCEATCCAPPIRR